MLEDDQMCLILCELGMYCPWYVGEMSWKGIKSGKCSSTYSFVYDNLEYISLMFLENVIIIGTKKN